MEYAKVIGGSLNMRKDTDIKSDRITSIPNGSNVAVLEKGIVWCKIIFNAYTGYVMTKFLEFESDSAAETITISLSKECAEALYKALELSLSEG